LVEITWTEERLYLFDRLRLFLIVNGVYLFGVHSDAVSTDDKT